MEGLTEGRIVHFVMPDGKHRPAIVVETWKHITPPCEGYVNLQVFTDSTNDAQRDMSGSQNQQIRDGVLWRASVCFDEAAAPGTWHWIERA